MRVVSIATVATAALFACNRGAREPEQPHEVAPMAYQIGQDELAGAPGSILRIVQVPVVDGDIKLPPATMYRLVYRSRGSHDEPIAVTGVMFVPNAPAPAGGRPIVAWQHPATGINERCAPSLSSDVARMIPGLDGLLAHGYVVVATDYQGLGSPGPHGILFGTLEGRAVLDAVRAARAYPTAQANARFALWGHSQGGHASLFAATLAPTYAPELQLVGVAAAAPPTSLATMLHVPPGTVVKDPFYAMVLDSWASAMDWPIDDVVRAEDVPNAQQLAMVCFSPPYSGHKQPNAPYVPPLSFTVRRDITTDEPWTDLIAENEPGVTPPGVPVLLAHGSGDTTVAPDLTLAYMAKLCAAGIPVRDISMPGVVHDMIARDAAPATVSWIEERFAGRPAPNDCGRERQNRSATRR